jgi:hypothetical protein
MWLGAAIVVALVAPRALWDDCPSRTSAEVDEKVARVIAHETAQDKRRHEMYRIDRRRLANNANDRRRCVRVRACACVCVRARVCKCVQPLSACPIAGGCRTIGCWSGGVAG